MSDKDMRNGETFEPMTDDNVLRACADNVRVNGIEDQIKAARKRRRREEKCLARESREGLEHERFVLESVHDHEVTMSRLEHEQDESSVKADRAFAIELIGALMPLVTGLGHGLLIMQERSHQAERARLDIERDIAEKSPGYALERVKLFAASGRLIND